MKKYLFLLGLCFVAATMMATVVNYTADDTSVFPNPERGFTEELGGETMLSNTNNHVVQPEGEAYFTQAAQQAQTLVMLMYYLGNYRSQDLSAQILQGFDDDMAILRQHGFKCVLRFAYDWNSKNDATLSYVKKHIASLKPHLEANKDVIYVLEAGFVGRWGEWYYSSNFGNKTQHLNENRRQVIEAMLDACPANRFLLTRYAMIKTEYMGDTQPLTWDKAFEGTDRARIGHHNDAFLNDYGNDGTYDDGDGNYTAMRNYIAQETLYVPNGGECNVEDKNLAAIVAQQDTTLAELRRFHWSFCGSQYAEAVTKKWRSNGTFEEMNRVLGYRLQLISTLIPDNLTAGNRPRILIRLVNKGCAPLYNERPVYLVLKNEQTSYPILLQADPRRWIPGQLLSISELVTIPADIPAGTYNLYLYLPDASPSIAADPRYAVRFANVGTWDASTGMNDLLCSVSVTNEGGQGIEIQKTAPQVHKVLRNGQLLIQKGTDYFDALGRKQ